MKRLIINADDFGFTKDVNAGIVCAHSSGVLTSTTLMANGDAFEDAVRLAADTPTLDIGCHLVLVQGRSVLSGTPFPERPRDTLSAVLRGELDPYGELRAQIEKIVAAGIRPTHLDSHKHTHVIPKVFRAAVQLAAEFGIPFVRLPLAVGRSYYLGILRSRAVRTTDHFVGFRLTGHLNEENFLGALAKVRTGTTEFMCHPGFCTTELTAAATRLKESRVVELHALTSGAAREIIAREQIQLQGFGPLAV